MAARASAGNGWIMERRGSTSYLQQQHHSQPSSPSLRFYPTPSSSATAQSYSSRSLNSSPQMQHQRCFRDGASTFIANRLISPLHKHDALSPSSSSTFQDMNPPSASPAALRLRRGSLAPSSSPRMYVATPTKRPTTAEVVLVDPSVMLGGGLPMTRIPSTLNMTVLMSDSYRSEHDPYVHCPFCVRSLCDII